MTSWSLRAERSGEIALGDGRVLAYHEAGPVDGVPWIFHPGAGASGLLAVDRGCLRALGVRWIAPSRPGLGRSSPSPGRSLLDWGADVAALVRALGLEVPRAIAFSQGAPFALACAHTGAVRSVVVVAGTDELAHPEARPALAPPVLALVERAARDPRGAEAYFAELGAAQLASMSVQMAGAADRAVYERPDFSPVFEEALAEGFSQGSAGYARDTLLAFSRWPFETRRIEVPIWLVHGRDDSSPVHSPDAYVGLAARLPRAERVVREGGASVLWTDTAGILALAR